MAPRSLSRRHSFASLYIFSFALQQRSDRQRRHNHAAAADLSYCLVLRPSSYHGYFAVVERPKLYVPIPHGLYRYCLVLDLLVTFPFFIFGLTVLVPQLLARIVRLNRPP